MADGKKEGKTKIQKSEYFQNEKSFLDEIKNIFLWFLKGYHLVKNKNLIKFGKLYFLKFLLISFFIFEKINDVTLNPGDQSVHKSS